MLRNKFFIFRILLAASFALFGDMVYAQPGEAVRAIRQGDAMREIYRFSEAREAYARALDLFQDAVLTADDSLVRLEASDKILLAENGLSMMNYVYSPEVVARRKFSLDDFFLYYPLPDKRWRQVPCQLDSAEHRLSRAVYVPEDAKKIHWSAEDSEGIRNIYVTEYQDTIWSVPALLNEHLTSPADEIFPMFSPDGKKMFFASEGLYGVGGFDIYVSEWDESSSDWSAPVNMGFPYSSPADDFLFINTEDGKHTVFASNRDCPEDSVWVYVLEYDTMPVRRSVSDSEELRAISSLSPSYEVGPSDDAKADIPENVDTKRYMDKMGEVRSLRDTISLCTMKIEDARVRWGQENDGNRKDEIAQVIMHMEMSLSDLRDSLEKAAAVLQQIEMEFLFNGVVIDPDKLLEEADEEIQEHTEEYVFRRNSFGGPLSMKIMEPEPAFDYSFKVLEEGQFAEDNNLPKGLVYQIQMFTSSTKAGIRQLKGLSPVFESRSANGRYVYRVGLFRAYNDVLANLNTVKKAGFRSAFIVAFNDGKEVKVSDAKNIEAKIRQASALYQVRIVTKGDLEMAIADGIRQQSGGKDIARKEGENGTVIYLVGPFSDMDSAERIAGFVRAMGVSGAECEQIPGKSKK